MREFFQKLFDTSDFPPRWHCGNWDSFLGWLHIISDLVIWLAYMAIPIMLFYFVRKRKHQVPFDFIFLLFCSFIFWCGTGHLIEAGIFWTPWYRFSGLVKFITAVVSVLTAIALFRVIPEALNLKTPAELEVVVDQRTAELKKTTDDLKRSNEDLEYFAYVASHDLQEPMRMVNQNTMRLEEYLQDKLDDRARKYINFAADGARRMQILVEDLLDYSRVKVSVDKTVMVDMNEIIETARKDLSMMIAENQAQIISHDLPKLKIDKLQIIRLIENLISNAIKYSDRTRKPVVEISAVKENDFWKFSVKDNGIGFEQKYAERIFMLFQRLHESSAYKGSGMGLTICKKIVDYHEGKIWAESVPGEGSTFFFTLPA